MVLDGEAEHGGGFASGERPTTLVRVQPKPSFCGIQGRGMDSDFRITPGVWPSCVALGRLLNLSGPSVSHLQKRESRLFLDGFVGELQTVPCCVWCEDSGSCHIANTVTLGGCLSCSWFSHPRRDRCREPAARQYMTWSSTLL